MHAQELRRVSSPSDNDQGMEGGTGQVTAEERKTVSKQDTHQMVLTIVFQSNEIQSNIIMNILYFHFNFDRNLEFIYQLEILPSVDIVAHTFFIHMYVYEFWIANSIALFLK